MTAGGRDERQEAFPARRSEELNARLQLGALFASPARAEAPPAVAITPQLVDAAKKEGTVVLYSSMDLPVGEKLGKAFEAQYPGMAVQIERSGSERLFQRVAQEFSSNIHAADVINSSDASHFIPWKKNGWLAPFVPEDVAKYFPDQYRDPDGMFATTRIWLSSIAYNTNLVKAGGRAEKLCRSARPEMGRQNGQGASRL